MFAADACLRPPAPLIHRSSVWAPPAFADAFSVSDIFPSSESFKCFVRNASGYASIPPHPSAGSGSDSESILNVGAFAATPAVRLIPNFPELVWFIWLELSTL